MSTDQNTTTTGEPAAYRDTETGDWRCALCKCPLQRTTTGDLADGIRAHFKTVHPDKELTT